MRGEKLYELDSYLREMDAEVLQCTEYKGEWASVLSATVFYPEGGGQPADGGVLDGQAVSHVFKKDGNVYHVTKAPLTVGAQVHGQINWQRRFDFMQQHTGEHIASGCALKLFKCKNVGFHLSENTVLLDVDKPLSGEDVAKIEALANQAVYENAPVRQFFPSEDEIEALTFREKPGRITGALRVVEVKGYDVCACSGTHTAAAGEVGMIKFTSFQKHKGGTRITMACGARALADYNEKQAQAHAVTALLSAKGGDITAATQALLQENEKLRSQLTNLKTQEINALAANAAVNDAGAFCYKKGYAAQDLRSLAIAMSARTAGVCIALGGDEGALQYALCSTAVDLKVHGPSFNTAVGGRGGGTQNLVQGSTPAPFAQFIEAVKALGITAQID